MVHEQKKNSIISGFVWKFGERLTSQGISFLVSLVLARLLSPDDYGTIALVLVFINLSTVFITSGFSTALIQKKDANSTDFSTIFYCSAVCSIIIYAVIFLAAPVVAEFYNNQQLNVVLRVFGLQVPLSVYNSVQNAYVSRHMLFKKAFVANVISVVVSGTIGIGMAMRGGGVWALVLQAMMLTICNTLVLGRIIPWHPEMKFSLASAKAMMKYSSRILVADLSGTFFGEIRSLIIGRVYTSADLAYYTKGQQLPNLVTGNLSTAVMSVLFPALSNENGNLANVKALTQKSLMLLSYVLFPALLGLAAVMEPLVNLLYTDKWAECIPYAQLLCVGFSVGVLGIVPLQALKAIGRSDVVMNLEFLKKPVYLILLIVGVNNSVLAVAITMVIYEIYGMLINMIQIKKYVGYSLKEQAVDMAPAFGLAIFMAMVVLRIPSIGNEMVTIVVKFMIGVIVYIAGSIILRLDAFKQIKAMLLEKIKR